MSPQKLNVVHHDDMEEFLRSLGELESIKKGEHSCEYCDSEISSENIGEIKINTNDIIVTCDSYNCYMTKKEDHFNIEEISTDEAELVDEVEEAAIIRKGEDRKEEKASFINKLTKYIYG